jgi:hypothetical protein
VHPRNVLNAASAPVNAIAEQAVLMEAAATFEQRVERLFEQKQKVTVEDLLTVVHSREEMNSTTFVWAVWKMGFRLDPKSPEVRDLQDFTRRHGRYKYVSTMLPRIAFLWSLRAPTFQVLFSVNAAASNAMLARLCRSMATPADKAAKRD